MKTVSLNKLVAAIILVFLGIAIFADEVSADNAGQKMKDKVKRMFVKTYDGEDLLNILANIDNDIRKDDKRELLARADEISSYLEYDNNHITKHEKKYSEKEVPYRGQRVLEIKYGKIFSGKTVILPLAIQLKPLSVDFSKNENLISSFKKNEINSAKVIYVSYDTGNKEADIGLNKLIFSLKRVDIAEIREDVNNLYEAILIEQNEQISTVSKIRDNLAVANFLLANDQAKAASKSVNELDSLMLMLIEAKSDSPSEQRQIRDLRKQLNSTEKVSDKKYLSEWEKIPGEVEDWWSRATK